MSTEALDRLEERVRLALAAMEELRRQNERLTHELEVERRSRGKQGRSGPAASLEKEIRAMRAERETVRERVARMIALLEGGE